MKLIPQYRLDAINAKMASVGPSKTLGAFAEAHVTLTDAEMTYVREYAKRHNFGHMVNIMAARVAYLIATR